MFSNVVQDIRITRRFALIAVTRKKIGKDYPPLYRFTRVSLLRLRLRRSTRNIDSNQKSFSRKRSLCRSRENNFTSLLRIAGHACQVLSLSIITLAYNICARVVYIHTGWSSIVLNVQSADNVPGSQPTLPTNLAIVRATSRAPYIRFLGIWARFCRKSPDSEIS